MLKSPVWDISWVDGILSKLILSGSCHTLCTWMASLSCGSSHVHSSGQVIEIFSYIDHLKGYSPMWVLSCSFKELDHGKHLSQFVHWYGFSPVLQFYDKFSSQTFPSFLLSLWQPQVLCCSTITELCKACEEPLYLIQHKSGHNPDLNRKTGNLRPHQ